MQYLKQSTAVNVRIGPFVDATDGVTPETGVALGAADQAELLKEGNGATTDISGATWAAITGVDGWYNLSLTTSHTDTLGTLLVIVQDASVCLPVFREFCVLHAEEYDTLVAYTKFRRTHAAPFSVSGTTMSAKDVSGSEQFSSTLTKTAGADPVTGAT